MSKPPVAMAVSSSHGPLVCAHHTQVQAVGHIYLSAFFFLLSVRVIQPRTASFSLVFAALSMDLARAFPLWRLRSGRDKARDVCIAGIECRALFLFICFWSFHRSCVRTVGDSFLPFVLQVPICWSGYSKHVEMVRL